MTDLQQEHPDLERLQALYALAVGLRQSTDPLLVGQYEGVIGRLSALLAVVGAPLPDDAVPAVRPAD